MMRFKRGNSFLFVGQMTVNGAIQDMTGWALKCQIRAKSGNGGNQQVGDLVADCPATFLDATIGNVQIGSNALDTVAWPLGVVYIDILATSPGGSKISTQTTEFLIQDRVTHA